MEAETIFLICASVCALALHIARGVVRLLRHFRRKEGGLFGDPSGAPETDLLDPSRNSSLPSPMWSDTLACHVTGDDGRCVYPTGYLLPRACVRCGSR